MAKQRRTYRTLTDALRNAIEEANVPFKQLERETGVLRQSLMKFAKGEQTLMLDAADKVAQFFGVRIVTFREKSEEQKRQRQIRDYPDYISANAHGPYKGTVPLSFRFDGMNHRVETATWRDLLVRLCNLIYEQNREVFAEVVFTFQGRRRTYFTRRQHGNRDWRRIGDTDIHLDTNLSANNAKELADALLRRFDYGNCLEVQTQPPVK